MPPIPTTMKIQHGFAVFTYSVFDPRVIGRMLDGWTKRDGYCKVTSYINLKTIIGFRVDEDGLHIDVKGHSEGEVKDLHRISTLYAPDCGFVNSNVNTSYIKVGSVTTEIVDKLCETLAPLLGAATDPPRCVDLLDLTGVGS